MLFRNHQKIIVLTTGVLVLACAANYFVLAWTEPTVPPTGENILAPINTGSSAQTKAGELTVSSLTTTGASPQIDLLGGVIHRANSLKGHNDLQLHSDAAAKAKIDLGKAGSDEIKLYTNSQERMRIAGNGDIYIKDLSDCFLEVDENGRMQCYTQPDPINKIFTSAKSTILDTGEITWSTDIFTHSGYIENPVENFCSIGASGTCGVGDEAVIKITMNATSVYKSTEGWSCGESAPYIKSYFYIKEAGETEWGEARELFNFSPYCYMDYGWSHNYCKCVAGSKSETWYYHSKQGDEIKVTIRVYEGSIFGVIVANLNGSSSAENLTFNREITNYVSCAEGKDILYYLDANATGEMWKVRERYWPENPLLMTITADGIPIGLIVQ